MATPGQSDEFFAAADATKIAGLCNEKVEDWVRFTQSTTTYLRMRDSWKMYYGLSGEGLHASSRIREVGPQGEYSLLTCNDYRNILQHLLVMTTANRPALECQAATTDADAMQECQLGNSLIDWYMRDKKVERNLKKNVEYALALSEGFLGMDWEPTLGEIYAIDPSTGMPRYEGDISFTNYIPMDVIRDPFRNDSHLPWTITVKWKNRFNLAAKYPDMADKILAVKPEILWKIREDFFNRMWFTHNDLIPELTFHHEKCEALPQGRIVKFLTKDILLLDSPLPYSRVPIFRTACADQMDTPYGYTPAFDLMGPQTALNLLDSIILTNQKTHGLGVVIAPEGANIQYSQLAEGLSCMTVNEKNGQLRAMNFTNTPKEIFDYRNMLKQDMQNLSAINSVIRGNPEANIGSGSFAALIASQAIQFNSGLEMSYAETCEDVGDMTIEMLQKFATTDRVAKIVGKNQEYMLQSFSGASISNIKKVRCNLANPLTKTTAGRMKMAEDLMQMGQIKRPAQYLEVMETGKLEPITQNETSSLANIQLENEDLMQGQKPQAMMTDDHHMHILEHLVILDNPEKRANPQFTGPATEHILDHINFWKNTDPGFSQALGRPPLVLQNPMGLGLPGTNPPMPPQPQEQAQGMLPPPIGAQPNAANHSAAPHHGGPPMPHPSAMKQATTGPGPHQLPSQPGMPTNPQTGQKFQPLQGPVQAANQR